jgi:hypothetical protein
VPPVRYELGFYIPEDGILHSHRRENLKPYITVMTPLIYGYPAITDPLRNSTSVMLINHFVLDVLIVYMD